MAIDTEAKRKSIAAIGIRQVGPVIVPDSTIAAADRQAIGYSYAGIAAASPGGGGITFGIFSSEGIHSNVFGGVVIR